MQRQLRGRSEQNRPSWPLRGRIRRSSQSSSGTASLCSPEPRWRCRFWMGNIVLPRRHLQGTRQSPASATRCSDPLPYAMSGFLLGVSAGLP